MKKDEILKNCKWSQGHLEVDSELFNRKITLDLFPDSNTEEVSDKMVTLINDFIAIDPSEMNLIQELLYKHCLECCGDISYGFEVKNGESEKEANLRAFGITDAKSAYAKSNVDHVEISEDDNRLLHNRYLTIWFNPAWENEHGCEIVLKNGKIVDFYGETGSYRQFE